MRSCARGLPARLPRPRPKPQGLCRTQEPKRAQRVPYEAGLQQGPRRCAPFWTEFPKGADLHVHLSGAVYAETFIREAGEDGLCVDPAALSFAKPPCTGNLIAGKELSGNLSRPIKRSTTS